MDDDTGVELLIDRALLAIVAVAFVILIITAVVDRLNNGYW